MSSTIKGFQADRAFSLVEAIRAFDATTIATVEQAERLIASHGIVSNYTYWERVELVLNDLGYDYDEIFEVLER